MDQPQERVEAPKAGTEVRRLEDQKTFRVVGTLHQDEHYWHVQALASDGETVTLEVQSLYGASPTFRIPNWIKFTVPE